MLRAFRLGDPHPKNLHVNGRGAVPEDPRIVWRVYEEGSAIYLHDFASGETRQLELFGIPIALEGDILHFLEGRSWEKDVAYCRFSTGDRVVVGKARASTMADGILSWHNDVDTTCYPRWAPWMEYHRISSGRSEYGGTGSSGS